MPQICVRYVRLPVRSKNMPYLPNKGGEAYLLCSTEMKQMSLFP